MGIDRDALIVGGGLNGPALALALASAGISSVVLDAAPAETRADPEFDGRAYALSLASRRMPEALGVWPAVADRAQAIERIARVRLALLDTAISLRDLNLPGLRLGALKGNRLGQYSIRINDQYRICFEWRDGDAHNVEIVDYH